MMNKFFLSFTKFSARLTKKTFDVAQKKYPQPKNLSGQNFLILLVRFEPRSFAVPCLIVIFTASKPEMIKLNLLQGSCRKFQFMLLNKLLTWKLEK